MQTWYREGMAKALNGKPFLGQSRHAGPAEESTDPFGGHVSHQRAGYTAGVGYSKAVVRRGLAVSCALPDSRGSRRHSLSEAPSRHPDRRVFLAWMPLPRSQTKDKRGVLVKEAFGESEKGQATET